jgi:uncharacterized alkaline shock family protein YloU
VTVIVEDPAGMVTVSHSVLTQIAVRAAESVDAVRVRRPRRNVDVTLEGGRVRASLSLAVRRGTVLPETARAVQERVADALGRMCDATVEGIDVVVEEIV